MSLYNEILYRPILNLLVFLYSIIPGQDIGVAIIILTLITRIIFLPLSLKTLRSQRAMNALAPKLNELKEKHKNDRVALNAATMALYKENKVNPFAGCLPLLIQLPILIALYQALVAGLRPDSLNLLYSFIPQPESLNTLFLGRVSIVDRNILLVLLAALAQFFQAKQSMALMQKDGSLNKEMAAFNRQMLYFMPIFIIIIGWKLQAGLMLYWITTTLFSMFEQSYIRRRP